MFHISILTNMSPSLMLDCSGEGWRMLEIEVRIIQVLHYEVGILLDTGNATHMRVMDLFC